MAGAGGAAVGGAGGQSIGGAAESALAGSGGSGAGGAGGQPRDGGTSDASLTCPVAFDGSNLSSGLVSWWRAEGNGNDSAGHNNNGSLDNVSFVPGPLGGQAFSFDGTTSGVVIQTSTTLDLATGFGISLWVKVAAWPSGGTFLVDKWVYAQEDKLVSITPDGHIGFLLYPTASPAGHLLHRADVEHLASRRRDVRRRDREDLHRWHPRRLGCRGGRRW